MSVQFNSFRDQAGNAAYAPQFTSDNYNVQLAESIAQSLTVPSNFNQWVAVFSFDPGLRIFVANNTTATVPGSSFAQSASQLNPGARVVNAGDVLSFITPDVSAFITVSFYAKPF